MTRSQPPAPKYKFMGSSAPAAPWIAMVHGVSQDHRIFDRQVDAFGDDHRLILIDLPGHGASSDMPGPYGLLEYATAIDAALAEAGIEKCHFWATHLSAGAGLLLACDQPALFRSLILEAPVLPGWPLPVVGSLLECVADAARERGLDAAKDIWWREGAWFDVIRARPVECRASEQRAIIDDFQGGPWLDAGLLSRSVAPLEARLANVPVPAIVINGEYDLSDFVEMADAIAAALPCCRRAVVPEAGGFPLWEFPDRVNHAVHGFLGTV